MHTLGAGRERGKEKNHTKRNSTKTQTNKKYLEIQIMKSVGSLGLYILLPDGRLCSTPGALSVPFSSGEIILSQIPLPAGEQQPSKLIGISAVHATFSEVIGSRVQLCVLLKF